MIQILGKGGRYIFCTTRYPMDDATLENALAMHDEVKKYRP
jgi:hypothetical protein